MMSPKKTAPAPSVPTEHEVEKAILELIAEAQERPVEELLEEFRVAGPAMPLDSLEAVEILLGLEERFSVRLPDNEETCAAFRSLGSLVERVREVAAAGAD